MSIALIDASGGMHMKVISRDIEINIVVTNPHTHTTHTAKLTHNSCVHMHAHTHSERFLHS